MLTLNEVLSDFALYAKYEDAAGAAVGSRAANGETPMHWMAVLGDGTGIRVLAQAGAEGDARDDDGNTPLHEASGGSRQLSAMRALLEAGADRRLRNAHGKTARDIAISDGFDAAVELLSDAIC